MATTPEQQLFDLTDQTGHIDEARLAKVFEQLKPVSEEFLLGKWEGGSFDTGHPTHKLLETMKWAGKDFRNVNDVDPIVLYGKDGQREWCKDYGHARLRLVQFRGQVSTAMVYDNFPIIDIFKYVSEDVVFGAMDNKLLPEDGTYYFYLRRIKTA